MAAVIPAEKMRWKAASTFERDQTGNRFDFAITKKVSDGPVGISLYMGPIMYEELKAYGHGLTHVMDLSWRILRPIAVLFLWMFRKLHTFIPNWGLVLIVFSIIIKFALYPLSKSSTDSMKKMSKLQPQIGALREKYKNDPQRVHKATMELYKQEGVNPFGGCLPMLLQMPIFIALYPVVGSAFELRQAMFIPRWIEDLSRPDPFYILPVAMGISMYLQQRTTMTDPSQRPMLYMMPALMVIFFANFSAGLTLYWLMFNLLSWAQQELVKAPK
jgi:YidC/Oxa1 family membrane protein insertase